jgi:protein ImuA
MRASVSMADGGFARLRRRIAEIEGRAMVADLVLGAGPALHPSASDNRPPGLAPRRGEAVLSLGIPWLDSRLAGGLRLNALHEIRAGTTNDSPAATGFAVAILARLAEIDDRPLLVVLEATARREAGLVYGPGLDRFGLDSKRLVIATPRRAEEALWVFEEGLRCRGLAAVLAELRGHPRPLDLTASRRLALRARDSGVMGLLLRQASRSEPGATATRWSVTSRPAADLDAFAAGIGRPAWRLALERNRFGMTGVFDVEWDHERLAFSEPVPALSRSRTAPSFDRPHPSPEDGAILAFRQAS